MAIVSGKSDIMSADTDPAKLRGRPIVTTFTATNAATDSSGSKYLLCKLPSCAILDALTAFQVENWGFAAIRIGTADDVDALVAVLKSAGTTVSPVAQFDAKHGKPLWEVLGLAADPGGDIALYAHAIANATGAGTLLGEVHYRFR